jgi:hypothetical protein
VKKIMHKLIAATALVLGISGSAHAVATSGMAGAYGVDVDVDIGTLNLFVDQDPEVSTTSGPVSNSAVTVGDSDSGLLFESASVQADVLPLNADVNLATPEASADASVTSVSLEYTDTLGITTSVLNIGATLIKSEAVVDEAFGSFQATGTTYVEDLTLGILGVNYLDGYTGFIPANTSLVDLLFPGDPLLSAGVSVTLNAQTEDCVFGGSSCTIGVNAIEIGFDASLLGILGLGGDVIIAHSEASLTGTPAVIPVPAALPLLLSGLGVLFAGARRRRLAA